MLFLTCTGSQFSAIYVSVPMVASIILFCTSNGSTTTCKSFFVIILSCDHLCDAVVFAWTGVWHISFEKSFNRFVQHATLITVGKFSTDKNSTARSRIIRPLSRAFKNILSPCSKAYLNVILDHKFSGIFRAVRSADKLIKAHCFPLEWTLKRSSPWWRSAEKNKAKLTSIFQKIFASINRSHPENTKACKFVVIMVIMEQKHARAAQNIVRTHPPFSKMTWRLRNCPGNTTSWPTDRHKSRFDST